MPQINNLERNMEDKIPKEINFLGEGWVNLIPRMCNQNEESITFAKNRINKFIYIICSKIIILRILIM